MRIFRLSVIFALVFLGTSADAATTPNGEIRELHNGARMQAMGGASIAVVNDETALLVNPAGLGKLRDFYGTLLDPEVDSTSSLSNMYYAKAFGNPFDPAEIAKTLDKSRDQYLHIRAQLSPSIVVRNFGFGIYLRNSMDAYMDPEGANMYTHYTSDYAVLLGYNLRLWDGRIKIGAVGKAISRIEVAKTLDVTADMSVGTNASEGAGLGGDIGITLTAPWTWLPTISAVARDVGGTNFEAGSGLRGLSTTTRPRKIEQDLDVALAVFPIHSGSTRSTFTLEYSKITEAQLATDKTRYMHVGYELNVSDILFLRAGYNQHYVTGGIEIASEHTQFQITSYGEDVGPDGTPIEDRRLIVKFSLRF